MMQKSLQQCKLAAAMTIRIKLFASLREQMGCSERTLPAAGITTARELWQASFSAMPPPRQIKVAINQRYADLDSGIKDGDEVAFFPPVTGG